MKFIVKATEQGQYYYCDSSEHVLTVTDPNELNDAIQLIEQLQSEGYYLGGWISYAAGEALDPNQKVIADESFPLITMLASRKVDMIALPAGSSDASFNLKHGIDQREYESQYNKLIDYILAGDLYQANYSFRTEVSPVADPFALFCQLEREHPVPYAAYIETDDWQVISHSPELFLARTGKSLVSEPMKGTIKRGRTYAEDEAFRRALELDEKNRAENIMIVDLMRNDLSRVCETGSVKTSEMFVAKPFHSLHQLTSRVSGIQTSDTRLIDILRATFPAGSITGAPKVRAMEVITELESSGRQAYTGSVGMFKPGGDFSLNVAIRTLTCQQQRNDSPAELGIGSGVVANSSGEDEWKECLLKSQFLHFKQHHSEVFETMLWRDNYLWLNEHLTRLEQSCRYFSIPYPEEEIKTALAALSQTFEPGDYRIRLAIQTSGEIRLTHLKLVMSGWGNSPLRLTLSDQHVDSTSPYQFHKTNHRPLYENGYQTAKENDFDEMIFLNEHDRLTEGAISSIFLRIDGQWVTPPILDGLLPGVWRNKAIEELEAVEQSVSLEQLCKADEIKIGNSLRLEGAVAEVYSKGRLIWALDK